MRYKKNIVDHIDWWLVIMYVVLMLIGWISIYAALYQEGSSIFNFSEKYGRQFIWMVVAVFIAIIILLFNWKFFEGFAYILYFISILSLIGVLIFGIEVNGAKFYPLRQSLEFKNKHINLGNIHFTIFSHLLLNCNEGSNKVELYKSIWPLDKEYQINKLDTHLTNLKNYLKEKLNFSLIFSTNLGSIYFSIN